MVPSDPVYLNDRGILFRDLGDNNNAMEDFNKAIAVRPGYALAYANRGYIQRSRQKLDEAIADASTAIKLDPKSVWAYENRAFAYEGQGTVAGLVRRCPKDDRAVSRLSAGL